MHDRLFAFQTGPGSLDLTAHASALLLDVPTFNACLQSLRYLENIRRSASGAGRIGIRGTPGFALGVVDESSDFFTVKKTWVGGEAFENFKTALDEVLATDSPK